MEMLVIFLYVMIGVVIMRMYWDERYSEEYWKCKDRGEADDAMAVLWMLVSILFWPIYAVRLIFIK